MVAVMATEQRFAEKNSPTWPRAHGNVRQQSNPSRDDMQTDLHRAAQANDLPALFLCLSGAEIESRDAAGRTPLLIATHANAVEAARVLIEAGADVNAKDSIQDTPFLYAGAEGRTEILRLILATGKANLKDTNRYGGTALIPAAHHGHPDTVRVLLKTGSPSTTSTTWAGRRFWRPSSSPTAAPCIRTSSHSLSPQEPM